MTSQLVTNVDGRLPQGGEFAGRNGDCVEYAYMVARCAAQPWMPCDDMELNRLTTEAIDDGEASSTGAMTNAELAWLCGKEVAACTQRTVGDLIAYAQESAGRQPLCMGFSNGQALPGNEQNVFGHCVAILDWDGRVFTLANGDSVQGRAGILDTATPAQIAEAQPTQVTILEVGTMTAYDGYFTVVSETDWQLTDNPEIHLSEGLLAYWRGLGGLPALPKDKPDYSLQHIDPVIAFQRCERGIIMYDPNRKFDNPPTPGPCYLCHINDPRLTPPAEAATVTVNGQEQTGHRVTISIE